MILNTGCRTDIPAYYSRWFYHRVKEGYVCTRNPYRPEQVLKYRLDPEVVDILCFCTKNPAPMLPRLAELNRFRQFWFVTLTPYGKEIEPNVPDKGTVLESIRQLSAAVGAKAVGWRYDPIFITEKYSVEYHLQAFDKMASELQNRVSSCVISFLDLYAKTKRNFPAARAVMEQEQKHLAAQFAEIGAQCSCLLGADIGMYNTCPHGCIYCYANYDRRTVEQNVRMHDPDSPFLIGGFRKGDKMIEVRQESYIDQQMTLF